jgi:hypothetical protein
MRYAKYPPGNLVNVINCTKIYTAHILVILTAVPFIRIVSGTVLASITPQPPVNAGSIVALPFIRLAHCTKKNASGQTFPQNTYCLKYTLELPLMQYTIPSMVLKVQFYIFYCKKNHNSFIVDKNQLKMCSS